MESAMLHVACVAGGLGDWGEERGRGGAPFPRPHSPKPPATQATTSNATMLRDKLHDFVARVTAPSLYEAVVRTSTTDAKEQKLRVIHGITLGKQAFQ